MNKWMIIVSLFFATTYAQQTIQRFPSESFLPRLGNVVLERMYPEKQQRPLKMEEIAKGKLFAQIRSHLESIGLEKELHELDFTKDELISVASPQANEAIRKYLSVIRAPYPFVVQIHGAKNVPLQMLPGWNADDQKWSTKDIGFSTEEAQQQMQPHQRWR